MSAPTCAVRDAVSKNDRVVEGEAWHNDKTLIAYLHVVHNLGQIAKVIGHALLGSLVIEIGD